MSSKEQSTKTSFANQQFNQTLNSHQHILNAYKEGIENALELSGELPIFLDTSVILSIYEISFLAREKIKQFLIAKKENIVLTQQVQFEFVKNREKVINAFQSDVTEQIPTSFKSEVLNKIIAFKNNNKTKLEDYQVIQEKLNHLEEVVKALHEDISKTVNDKKGTANSILLEDEFIDILSETQLLTTLNKVHLNNIKDDYLKLLPTYKSSNNDTYTLNSFPGCAEKGEKDDPTGDYIIFHEMMEYALEKKTDVIFLTNDSSKGDWMRKDGKTHFHYIENFYLNTGQIIYIINAERLFEDLFETSFESLIQNNIDNLTLINEKNLIEFLNNYEPFKVSNREMNSDKMELRYISELNLNNIIFIEELKRKLDATANAVGLIFEKQPRYGKIGLLRACLKVENKNYRQIGEDGDIIQNAHKYDSIRAKWIANKN